MKYHYQYVSKNTVRIELIPEDKKEIALVEKLAQAEGNDPQLNALYQKGLEAYSNGTTLTKIKFMNFPSVALCNYLSAAQAVENVA